jgi:hypothetical protein
MSLDPIRFFSRCQAAFFERSDLEMKIYTFTVSALAGAAYYFSDALVYEARRMGVGQTALKISGLTWLFLSTVTGFCLRPAQGPQS